MYAKFADSIEPTNAISSRCAVFSSAAMRSRGVCCSPTLCSSTKTPTSPSTSSSSLSVSPVSTFHSSAVLLADAPSRCAAAAVRVFCAHLPPVHHVARLFAQQRRAEGLMEQLPHRGAARRAAARRLHVAARLRQGSIAPAKHQRAQRRAAGLGRAASAQQ